MKKILATLFLGLLAVTYFAGAHWFEPLHEGPPVSPDLGTKPVGLIISLDRASYLEFEPIFVECALWNNQEEAVSVFAGGPMLFTSFKGNDGDGNGFAIGRGYTVCLAGPPPAESLAPGKCVRGWVDLRDWGWGKRPWNPNRIDSSAPGYRPPPPVPFSRTASLSLHAYNSTSYRGLDGNWSDTSSGKVSFRIVAAQGEDAKAAKLIEGMAGTKRFSPDDVGNHYLHPGSEGVWHDPELCRRILRKTKSPRFSAVANFYLGYSKVGELSSFVAGLASGGTLDRQQPNPTLLGYQKEAAEYLEACINSEGASPYMRGLARYYLLHARMEADPKTTPGEIKRLAETLIKDYPNTYMAQEAQKILDKLAKQ